MKELIMSRIKKTKRYQILYSSADICTPAAFPAGVDPNRGNEETVRSPGVL